MLTNGVRKIWWKVVFIMGFIGLYTTTYAQQTVDEDFSLIFKSTTFTPEQSLISLHKELLSEGRNCFENKHYIILQFHKIPDKASHQLIRSLNIDLLEYIPNLAYIAAVPGNITPTALESLDLRAAIAYDTNLKIDSSLLSISGNQDIIIYLHKNVRPSQILNQLGPTASIENRHTLRTNIATEEIEEIASLPFVKYIALAPEQPELLDTRSRSVRGTYLNTPINGGLTGEGVIVGVGDGGYASHIDLKGRSTNLVSENDNQDHYHANMVAGMIGGGGVLRERIKGVAPECSYIMDRATEALQDVKVDANVAAGMVITNNAYGSGEGGIYSIYSARTDDQLKRHPQLMHVFSAGNSGNKTRAGYPAGYNTVLTNGQSAKNAISVGGINHYNERYSGSSQGPTLNGRLKPEITATAYGFSTPTSNNNYQNGFGTSFSAPQVAGGLALLYEHYRNINNGENPEGALLKAIICNTAEELGNPGPDYTYGYGKLNLRRAKDLLDDQHYIKDVLETDESKNYSINVPPNTHELKIMLYWPDTSASVVTGKDLVNDLDMRVIGGGSIYLPYILSTTPAEVASNAFPGVDRHNNIEQVVVKNPSAGNYAININSYRIPFEEQEFYIVYEFVQAGVKLVSPVAGEIIPAGGSINYYIEWDYYGDDNNTFTLEYSPDEGSNWVMLSDSIDASSRIFRWKKDQLVNMGTSQALIKIERNNTNYIDVTPTPFHAYSYISRQDFNMTPLCDDDILFEWPFVNDAVAYELLQYDGNTSMEVIATTTDTSYLMTYPYSTGNTWFSLRVLYPNDIRSIRTDAKLFIPPSGDSPNSCPPSSIPALYYYTGQYHIQFSWEAATDDGAVIGYNIYKDSVFVEAVDQLHYMVHYTESGVGVEYCVSAYDANGNESPLTCFNTATFVENSCNQDVIFITKDRQPSDDESIIADQLQGTDFHIFTIGSNEVQDYLWDKNWTAIISPEAEIDSNDLALFDDLPLILLNFDLVDDFNLASSNAGIFAKDIEVTSPYHPVSAAMSGTIPFYTSQYLIKGASLLPPAAVPIIRYQNFCTPLFVYHAGSEMANGVITQERRVAYPLLDYHVEHLTTPSRILLESSLAWAASCTVPQPYPAVDLMATPGFTNIDISWDYLYSGTQNLSGYAIYLNDVLIATTSNTSYSINGLDTSTEYKISVAALGTNNVESSRIFTFTETLTCKEFDFQVYLEGAIDTTLFQTGIPLMRTTLNDRGLLPGQSSLDNQALSNIGHPYYNAPWFYQEYESIDNYDFNAVDWVLVSLRTDVDKSSEIFQTTGLLYQDGHIEFQRACIEYEFSDSVYVVIEHRNHMGIMTPTPVELFNNQFSYDFRIQNSYSETALGQKEIFPGIYAMYAGDGSQLGDNPSFQINGSDKIQWTIWNGSFGVYREDDFNLDGDVNGADKSIWHINNGVYSSVPR